MGCSHQCGYAHVGIDNLTLLKDIFKDSQFDLVLKMLFDMLADVQALYRVLVGDLLLQILGRLITH